MCLFSNEKELVASANIRIAGTRKGQVSQNPKFITNSETYFSLNLEDKRNPSSVIKVNFHQINVDLKIA